jgi:hypothetical protein
MQTLHLPKTKVQERKGKRPIERAGERVFPFSSLNALQARSLIRCECARFLNHPTVKKVISGIF